MTTLSRVVAYVLAAALAGGLAVLAVAGVPAATAVLVTGGAVLALIVLGGSVGGRRTPTRRPVPGPGQRRADPEPEPEPDGPGDAAPGGTMDG